MIEEFAQIIFSTQRLSPSAPILVVEVVSLDSVKRDYRHKHSEYAALEIPEYWIVDPIKSKIMILLLSEG